MRMNRAVRLVLACSALLAWPAGAAAKGCDLPGSRTVLANAQARIFVTAGKPPVTRRYFGCLAGRRPILLTTDRSPKAADEARVANDSFRLAGPWVAYHYTRDSDAGAGESTAGIVVRSLGKSKRQVRQEVKRYGLKNLALAPNGDVAWVLSSGNFREIDGVLHTSGTPTPLAVAVGIASASLSLAGGKVSFTQGGVRRTVALTAPAPPATATAVGPQGLDGRFGDCGTLVPAAPKPNSFTAATQLAKAPNGALVSAGTATSGQGNPLEQDTFVVARFSAGGRFDSTFAGDGVVELLVPRPPGAGDAHLTGLVVQPDGRIVIAGWIQRPASSDAQTILARYTADGRLDASFGTGGVLQDVIPRAKSADLRDLASDAAGRLYLAGQRDGLYYVARLTADGKLDDTFGTGGLTTDPGSDRSSFDAVTVQPDGTVFAAGTSGLPLLARFDAAGKPLSASSAGPPATGRLVAIEPTGDGGAVAVGVAANVIAQDQLMLARYGADGKPDTGFDGDGFVLDPQIAAPSDIAVADDGSLYVSASFFLRPGGYAGNGLVHYSADGARDTGFGIRGALGGTSSFGLDHYDVLMGDAGTAFVAQDNGGAYAVSRFAVGAPATTANAARSSVCAMATATQIAPLLTNRRLDVSLRLRAPGKLHLEAVITARGRTVKAGVADVLRPFTEGAIASVPLGKAALTLLRGARTAKLVVTAGAPGKPSATYRATLTR